MEADLLPLRRAVAEAGVLSDATHTLRSTSHVTRHTSHTPCSAMRRCRL
jgi:hypothetical protein